MKDFPLIRMALYPLFFVYPFVSFQFVYGELNIPVADLLALLLGAYFFLVVIGEFCLRARLPEINRKGLVIFSLFLIAALVSLKNAPSFGESFKYFFRNALFYPLIYFAAIGSILIWHGRMKLIVFYDLLCASAVLISIISIATSLLRLSYGGTIGDASSIPIIANNHKVLAITLSINLPLLIAMAKYKANGARLIYYIAIFLCVVAVILSFSKASWLSLVVIASLFNLKFLNRLSYLKPVIILASLVVMLVGGFYLYELFAASKDVTRAEGSRLFLAWLAIQMFINNPVFGGGIGAFTVELQQYVETLSKAGFPGLSELDAHGLFFKLLSETGIAGFTFYIGFYAVVFYSIYKAYIEQKGAGDAFKERLLYGCIGTLVSIFLLNSFFGTDAYSPRSWFPLAFVAAHRYLLAGGDASCTMSIPDEGQES